MYFTQKNKKNPESSTLGFKSIFRGVSAYFDGDTSVLDEDISSYHLQNLFKLHDGTQWYGVGSSTPLW
jgi:hypothetical protein